MMADETTTEAPPTTTPAAGATAAPPNTVPYSRFSEVVNERNSFAERLKTLEAQAAAPNERLTSLEATAATLQAERDALAARVELMRHGIDDDDGAEVVRALYSRLPAENRPKLGDWLGTLKADPTKMPKPLAPYLAPPAAAAAAPAYGSRPAGMPSTHGSATAGATDPRAQAAEAIQKFRRGELSVEDFKKLSGEIGKRGVT